MNSNFDQSSPFARRAEYTAPIFAPCDTPLDTIANMPYDALCAFIGQNSLPMSASELIFCKDHFIRYERRFPTMSELRLLSSIIRKRSSRADALRASRLFSADSVVNETVSDIYAKAEYLKKYNLNALSLKDCAEIAPAYIATLTAKNSPKSAEDELAPIFAPAPLVLMLILPDIEMEQGAYRSAVQALYGNIQLYGRLGPVLTVNEYGLLATLARHTDGVFGDLSGFPVLDGENALEQLSSSYIGRNIICTPAYMAPWITDASRGLGLCAYNIGSASGAKKLFFTRKNAPALSLDKSFVLSLTTAASVKDIGLMPLSTEYSAPALEPTVMLNSETDETVVACSDSLTGDPFRKTIDIALSVLLTMLREGARRRNISFECEIVLPEAITDAQNASDAFLAILGAYRFFIELCVDVSMKVSFEGEKKLFTCTARAKCSPTDVTEHLEIPPRGARSNSGLPEFAALRRLCEELEARQKKKI